MEVGLRVVRGPDWKWQNQDGGEGHVGTVVEVGKPGNSNTPDKTVVVQWDLGFRTNYRVGYQGLYDLCIFDSAPTGVKHSNIECNSCRQSIQGIRWKCSRCPDYDLCHSCYMSDKHDLNHTFFRIQVPGQNPSSHEVPKRANSKKIEVKGIFSNARVVRGPDWDWGNQDGGAGKQGRVIDIRGWENESGRSVANVVWDTGTTNVYRLGHKGKVDLKYVPDKETSGGFYYRDHLPKLGDVVQTSPASPVASSDGVVTNQFKVGDKVTVGLDVDVIRVMQEGHGGWNPKMAEHIGRIGMVHRITDRGDIRVQYPGCSNRWTFHPGALTKVPRFEIGDSVKISDDLQVVSTLQRGHGEWTENMKQLLGKTGKVVRVYPDDDIRVVVEGKTFTLNPKCCSLANRGKREQNNTLTGVDVRENDSQAADQDESVRQYFNSLLSNRSNLPQEDPEKLVREAAQGHLETVRELVSKHPDRVNQKSNGKTALQVAAHQGHMQIIQLLLLKGASLDAKDEDGDTALHYSAFGDQPEVMGFLLEKGAKPNLVNKGGCTALHVSVNKQHVRCVQILIENKCDVNLQDMYGDTSLHDAVGKESKEITDLLLACPNIDLSLKNVRGFNVLHHAALKGNNHATETILSKSRQMVDVKKDDGFAALHLSSLNGHLEVTQILIEKGRADIEIRNGRKQTSLLLAVSQGHAPVVEFLVRKGADVEAEDEDGETSLHAAVVRQSLPVHLDQVQEILRIHSELSGQIDQPASLSIVCFLLMNGANKDHKNPLSGTLPLASITDPKTIQILNRYIKPKLLPLDNGCECIICCETPANVLFLPCGHQVACIICSARMKKCLSCQETILEKIGPDGNKVTKELVSTEESRQLMEIQLNMEREKESHVCSICMENKWNVAFKCGHSACSKCAEALKICHICRKQIDCKINLFT